MLTDQRVPSGPLTEQECIDMYFSELRSADLRRSNAIDVAQREYDRASASARTGYQARILALRNVQPSISPHGASATVTPPSIVGVDSGGHVMRAGQEMGRTVLQEVPTPMRSRMQPVKSVSAR